MTDRILVIDVGGTAVKLGVQGATQRRFPSGRRLTPRRLDNRVRELTADWKYNRVSLGYPGRVRKGVPAHEPWNVADGWVGFDYAQCFGCPVRIMNDAALQALGNYAGGRMLFVGLGTSVGAALIVDGAVVALELGGLAHPGGGTLEERLSSRALHEQGQKLWKRAVVEVLRPLLHAFDVDEIVLGGGQSKRFRKLPRDCRAGADDAAIQGGIRLWQCDADESLLLYRPPSGGSSRRRQGRQASITPAARSLQH